MSGEHTKACGTHGSTVGLMFHPSAFDYPLSWGFLLSVVVVLLLFVGMSQGLMVRQLHEQSSGRVFEGRPACRESSYVVQRVDGLIGYIPYRQVHDLIMGPTEGVRISRRAIGFIGSQFDYRLLRSPKIKATLPNTLYLPNSQQNTFNDEVGFVHPTQFAMLAEDSTGDAAISDGTTFWSRDHKLGVSTQAILPLYNAAKRAFIAAMEEYKRLGDCDDGLESEVMGCIVRLSCCSAPISALPGTQEIKNELSEQVLHELKISRNWAGLHVADNCCFHYRRRLMLRILKDSTCKLENASPGFSVEVSEVWKEELDWNEMLIKRYIGREALWLHRRFLSLCWMKQFSTNLHDVSCHSDLKISTSDSFNSFIDNELQLLNSCSTVPDNDFEDFQAQATYSATYTLWVTKQIPEIWSEFQEKLTIGNLKTMLSKVCPERSFLWDSLID
nr:hypothetical protein CFP56_67657 [Quercus suber]